MPRTRTTWTPEQARAKSALGAARAAQVHHAKHLARVRSLMSMLHPASTRHGQQLNPAKLLVRELARSVAVTAGLARAAGGMEAEPQPPPGTRTRTGRRSRPAPAPVLEPDYAEPEAVTAPGAVPVLEPAAAPTPATGPRQCPNWAED